MADEEAALADEVEVTSVESLEDIIRINKAEGVGKSAPPDPIHLSWKAGTQNMKLSVTTRWPKDTDAFAIEYLQSQVKSSEPEVGDDGKPTFPNKDCHLLLLRRELIVEPTWLHNKSAFAKFAENVPPGVVSSLHRKLRLIGGLDADFFEDYQTNIMPLLNKHSAASANASGSSPTKSPPAADEAMVPSTSDSSPNTTTGASAKVSVSVPPASSTPPGPPPSPTPSLKENAPPTPS